MEDPPDDLPWPAASSGTNPGRRASDAERQAVVDQLRVATGAGRISLDEFAERVGVAWGASTHGDLETLTADLPTVPSATTATTAGSADVEPADVGVESMSNRRRQRAGGGRGPKQRRHLVNVFGSAHHAGGWTAEGHMTVVSVFGHSHVDLTTCRLDPEVELVELRTIGVFGGIELLVPPGTAVDAAGFMLFGGRHVRHDAAGGDAEPTLRVSVRSYGAFGSVLVRSPRRVP